jgi:hypothetical protein
MKQTLTAIALFFTVCCWGQKKISDTNYVILGIAHDSTYGYFIIGDLGGTSYGVSSVKSFGNETYQDTVRCIMLVCDTSFTCLTSVLDVYENADSAKRFYEIKNRVPHVWWQFGYAVDSIYSIKIKYLDQNKKPLSKSIIVWILKTL